MTTLTPVASGDPVRFTCSDGAGTAWAYASVQVNVHGGGAATIYSDAAMTLQAPNPLRAGANGEVSFFVAAGTYDLVVTAQSGASDTATVTVSRAAPDRLALESELGNQTGALVPANKTQAQATEVIWTYTPNAAGTIAEYQSLYTTETYGSAPAVTETCWSLGYNINNEKPGEIAGYLKWLPKCGDTKSLEWEFDAVFPDGTFIFAFQYQAMYDGTNKSRWIMEFATGTDLGGYFTVTDTAGNGYITCSTSSATGGQGLVQLQQANLNIGQQNTTTSSVINKYAPSGNIVYDRYWNNNVLAWSWMAYSSYLRLHDDANDVDVLYITPGAGVNGSVKLGAVLLPVQAATASAPTYVKGGMYFDTTLNKLRVGGASTWETVTSS